MQTNHAVHIAASTCCYNEHTFSIIVVKRIRLIEMNPGNADKTRKDYCE